MVGCGVVEKVIMGCGGRGCGGRGCGGMWW